MVAGMSVTQRASHAWGVWSGVVSAALFAGLLTDCRPPVASSRELGVGPSAFQNLQAQQARLGRQTTVGES